jgi:hypothetical protein
LVLVTISALVAGLCGAGTPAGAAPPPQNVSISTVPDLFPKFGTQIPDYVVRCNNGPVTVRGKTSNGWEAAIDSGPFHSGTFVQPVPLGSGRDFTIIVRKPGSTHPLYRYHVRCLPNDFPTYTFTRFNRPVSPRYFSVDPYGPSLRHDSYAIIFNKHGVPIWWKDAPAHATRVLPSGNILWFSQSSSPPNYWEIHRLDGTLVRTLDAVGHRADRHDLQPVGTAGDYLVGVYVRRPGVDTSAYGGSSNATVSQTVLQQVSSTGELLWDWRSWEHISLGETPPHRWPWSIDHGYDIEHWNSIEPAGDSVLASFRHLDAVYKIRKSTGAIVWKLGGTRTSRSLRVIGDPRSYTFGAQHDARLLDDGTVTVFDNRTNVGNHTPRAVRFRINGPERTATLLESITDPAVTNSYCCGSARKVPSGDWLVSWGRSNPVAGYKPGGARTFRLTLQDDFSYRAEPVPSGAVSPADLRQGMDAMCSAGC